MPKSIKNRKNFVLYGTISGDWIEGFDLDVEGVSHFEIPIRTESPHPFYPQEKVRITLEKITVSEFNERKGDSTLWPDEDKPEKKKKRGK